MERVRAFKIGEKVRIRDGRSSDPKRPAFTWKFEIHNEDLGLNMPNLDPIFGSIPSEANNAQNVEGQINEHSPNHGLNLDKETFGEKDASLHEDD
ncbi:uncharacterized protein G2W53_004048 [Senna tora]|uniref:Uncharacterized protein n=1 Tax=Senna tora TaxID=362788 RepID=A0A834XB36_9FABA|nr:uncharacterized protein G2W53_004048 [Senna tora]